MTVVMVVAVVMIRIMMMLMMMVIMRIMVVMSIVMVTVMMVSWMMMIMSIVMGSQTDRHEAYCHETNSSNAPCRDHIGSFWRTPRELQVVGGRFRGCFVPWRPNRWALCGVLTPLGQTRENL